MCYSFKLYKVYPRFIFRNVKIKFMSINARLICYVNGRNTLVILQDESDNIMWLCSEGAVKSAANPF